MGENVQSGDNRGWSAITLAIRLGVSAITFVVFILLLRQPPDWLQEGLLKNVAVVLAAVAGLDFVLSAARVLRTTLAARIRRLWAKRRPRGPSTRQSERQQNPSSDGPIVTVLDDQLGFAKYACVLAESIASCPTPTTIGIHGEWGAGKTSLGKLIAGFLSPRGKEWDDDRDLAAIKQQLADCGFDLNTKLPADLIGNLQIIWLNAWQYADAQSLWRAYILQLASRLEDEGFVDSTAEWQTKLYYNVTQEGKGEVRLSGSAITLAVVGALAMFLGSLLLPSTWILLALANLGTPGSAKFKLPSLDNVFERTKYTKMRKQMDSIEQFRDELQQLVARLLDRRADDKSTHMRKVIVFIDDLDRCSPNVALEIMETIKTFLDVPGCVYVLLCDERLIGQGVRNKFKELFGDEDAAYQRRGREYIEKIIQISFNIPPVNAKDLRRYAGMAMMDVRKDGDTDLPYFDIVHAAVGDNPRKIKRVCRALEIAFQMMQLALGRPIDGAAVVPQGSQATAPQASAPRDEQSEAKVSFANGATGATTIRQDSPPHQAQRTASEQRSAFAKTFCLQYRWPEATAALRAFVVDREPEVPTAPAAVRSMTTLSGGGETLKGADANLIEAEKELESLLENVDRRIFADALLTVDWERAPATGKGAIKRRNLDLWAFLETEPFFETMHPDELRNYIEWSAVIGRDEPPKPAPAEGDERGEEAEPDGAVKPRRLTDTRLLWVDDQPDNNAAAVRRLSEEGAEVLTSTSTDDALEHVKRRDFDAIITDQRRDHAGVRNDEAGYELLRALQERGVDVPVILSTATPDIERAQQAGFYAATNSEGVFDLVVKALGGGVADRTATKSSARRPRPPSRSARVRK